MSSVIVQMLPSLTLEPAGMGAAARAPSTVLLHRRGLGALEFSPVPQQCALQLNWECVPLLPPLAVCCPELGVQLPQPQLPRAPCTHCQGQTLPWGPGPGLGHRARRGVWKCSRTCSTRFGALHCQGCSELPPAAMKYQ